ncbi:hypothetical protein DFH08DRAFT_805765 [Mycena albidolilacea]|uniref:Aminoacyl-tRNA hydrolase n=1 Tax=Mycena albidolilacea TaxID=1033008 RepID=A0AAD7A9E5_9AGAR|nr:hypothetical protein DFH08DRAFT_805765 [Mycena albidolilacea]
MGLLQKARWAMVLLKVLTVPAGGGGVSGESPAASSKHGGGRRVSFNCQPVTSMHEASRDLQSSVRLVSPGGGGEPMSLSPLLALFDDDYNAEMGIYVISGEKLKVFLANRAGLVATSQAAHAIANLTASGGSSAEDRMQEDQDPRFEAHTVLCPYLSGSIRLIRVLYLTGSFNRTGTSGRLLL